MKNYNITTIKSEKKDINLVLEKNKSIRPNNKKLFEWHKNYLVNHAERIACDFKIIRNLRLPKKANILDCGSLPLMLTSVLPKLGLNVQGVDIDPGRYRKSIKNLGLKIKKCNIENDPLPFKDESFDAVAFFEIFEHLRIDPIFVLTEIARVTKPSGILVLSSPNLKSLKGYTNFVFKDLSYSCSAEIYAEYMKLRELGHMGHVREYTVTEIINFLDKMGFEVEKVIFRGSHEGKFRILIKLIYLIFPSLKPFVTYVARKR